MPEGTTKIFRRKNFPVLGGESKSIYWWESAISAINPQPVETALRESQERSRLSTLQAQVGTALVQGGTMATILNRCTEAMVEHDPHPRRSRFRQRWWQKTLRMQS